LPLRSSLKTVEKGKDNPSVCHGKETVLVANDNGFFVLPNTFLALSKNINVVVNNCLHPLSSMNFHVSYIYKEGNKCADILANLGLTLASHEWFPQPHTIIRADLMTNKLGLPNFRVT